MTDKELKNWIGRGMLGVLCAIFVGVMVYSIGILPSALIIGVSTAIVIWVGVAVNLLGD